MEIEKALNRAGMSVISTAELIALRTLAQAFVEGNCNETPHGQIFGNEEFIELQVNAKVMDPFEEELLLFARDIERSK